MKPISIEHLYSQQYLSERGQVIEIFRKKIKKASCKDLEEIYDYAYSFGEEYGRKSEMTYTTVKIIINLASMTELTTDDISTIVNPNGDEKISQHIVKIKNCFSKNNKKSITYDNPNR